jgi:hypothetical protein
MITTRVIPAVGALAILAACSGDPSTAPVDRSPPPQGATRRTALVIENATSYTLTRVFTRACGGETFSLETPGASDLAPRASRTIDVPAGCYDVAVVSDAASGSQHAHVMSQTVGAGGTTKLMVAASHFHSSGSRSAECLLPEGSPLSGFRTADGFILLDSFGDAAADAALRAETAGQYAFWKVPATVYVLWDAPGRGANAMAWHDGKIGLGYHLYYEHGRAHGAAATVGGTLAHEWGHQIQYSRPWFADLQAYRRQLGNPVIGELEADAFAGYYMYLKRAQSWDDVRALYTHMASLGTRDGFTNPNFHGTPEQRMAAVYVGVAIAEYAVKNRTNYTVDQLHQGFMTNIFRILGLRAAATAAAADLAPAVEGAVERLEGEPLEQIARGTSVGRRIPAPAATPEALRALWPASGSAPAP